MGLPTEYCNNDYVDERTLLRKGFCSGSVTYGTLISKGLCKIGKIVKLLQMTGRQIIKTNLNLIMYNRAMNGFCKEGLVNEVFELCSEIIRQGISLDIVTYNILIHGILCINQMQDFQMK